MVSNRYMGIPDETLAGSVQVVIIIGENLVTKGK
jgi:hypothetical protein